MSVIGKLIGVALAGQSLAVSAPLFQRLITGVAAIIGLAILSAILVGALLIGGLYLGYEALLAHGLEPNAALLVIAMLVIMIIAILVAVLITMVNRLKEIPDKIMEIQSPITSRATSIGRAFLQGFTNGRSYKANRVTKLRAVG